MASRFSRLAKLGGLTTRVTGSYVAEKIRDTFRGKELRKKAREKLHIESAKEIVDTVGKLKGAAMKLGQQMAVAAASLDLPDEVTDVLGTLHKDAEPIPFTIIKEDLEKELEAPLASVFASFDPDPIGTASLGQAHAAQLPDGTEVVVKVLHRGVEHSVDTDLMALKTILVSGRVLRRSKQEIDDAFAEIHERLTEELDYLQEAANIYTFAELFEGDDRIRIPTVHTALCTERVLTMDRLPGKHIDAFVQTATEEARLRAAESLAHVYYKQVFEYRTMHADPHPGNYLFEDDGRIGLLDFGCVKRFDEFWMGNYARAAIAMLDDDRERCLDACHHLGAWDGEDQEAGEVLWQFCRAIGKGFRLGKVRLGEHREQLMEDMKPAIKGLIMNRRVTAPRHIIFLHRSLGGMYSLARKLEAELDFGAVVRIYAQRAVDRADGKLG